MKTVRVRIAVAVGKRGVWAANGWSSAVADDAMDTASECCETEVEARYWLTAELPIPEPVTVQAEVEKDEG